MTKTIAPALKSPAAPMTESGGRRAAELPPLTALQKAQIAALENELGDFRKLGEWEVKALGMEALEAYFYGERTRWDVGGKKWFFRREPVGNAFQLSICCSIGPVVLVEAAVPLDQVASKAGEEAVIDLVFALAEQATPLAKAAKAYQQSLRPEVG